MGCLVSTPRVSGGIRSKPGKVGEIVVFVPGLRIPKPIDFSQPLGDALSKSLIERLSALRTRIVVMAGQEEPMSAKPRRTATQHESHLQHMLQFVWANQEDYAEVRPEDPDMDPLSYAMQHL
ncbi:hypothetical protein L1049_017350 [Liquidambar formosana]|uniref:Uncharacterized protein n=1 Tax=Liquidambar formosana TaxID=63359 RepID=A0AAP0S3E9_LIQFO